MKTEEEKREKCFDLGMLTGFCGGISAFTFVAEYCIPAILFFILSFIFIIKIAKIVKEN